VAGNYLESRLRRRRFLFFDPPPSGGGFAHGQWRWVPGMVGFQIHMGFSG
jgi:hypothetical protein